MKIKRWHTRIEMASTKNEHEFRYSAKSFSMVDAQKILKRRKTERSKAGLPKRKILPLSLWLLDELIDSYFEKNAKNYRFDYVELERVRKWGHT